MKKDREKFLCAIYILIRNDKNEVLDLKQIERDEVQESMNFNEVEISLADKEGIADVVLDEDEELGEFDDLDDMEYDSDFENKNNESEVNY